MREIKAYLNEKNKLFLSKAECAKSDNLVECRLCKDGKIFYKEKIVKPYPKGYPDSGWAPDTVTYKNRTKDCERCNGLGYCKSEDNIEDDPEYIKYLELKEKFSELEK